MLYCRVPGVKELGTIECCLQSGTASYVDKVCRVGHLLS